MCVGAWYVFMSAGARGGQNRASNLPRAGFQLVMSCLTWVLRTMLRASGRALWILLLICSYFN